MLSKIFYAWLTGIEGRVKIHSPKSVRESYRNYLKNILEEDKKD